ncbi:MAG: hypothetical protein NZ908_02120 [Candidatus Micrarchaeota archaeon]|nr:hypothetical protein [Candidatus Micrarchaeota archaeon]MCX8154614.1 hypothetical protein [Candidatus Micrarchaeota archaeon]
MVRLYITVLGWEWVKIHIKLEFEKDVETIPEFRGAVMALVKYLFQDSDIFKDRAQRPINFTYFLQTADGKGVVRGSKVRFITLKINLVDGRLSSLLLSRINTLKRQGISPGQDDTKMLFHNDLWRSAGKISLVYAKILPHPTIQTYHATFRLLSPVVVRRTLANDSVKMLTKRKRPDEVYLTPQKAQEWEKALSRSIAYRYESITKSKVNPEEIIIERQTEGVVQKIKHYRGVLLGWKGILKISAKPDVLNFIARYGLGDRTAQGFGYVEVIKNG